MSECARAAGARAVKAWKIKLHRAELRMLAEEVAHLQGEAECYRLAKRIYEELLKLDSLLAEKEKESAVGDSLRSIMRENVQSIGFVLSLKRLRRRGC